MVLVDDSHSTGFIGKTGRGTHEHFGVMDKVDIITTTLGKALGGANGGLVAGPREVIEMLRNRGRPYLFSNAVPPPIVYGAMKAIELLSQTTELRDRWSGTRSTSATRCRPPASRWCPGETPIVPVMLGDAKLANDVAQRPAARRDLRHRLQPPRGADGQGAHPHAALAPATPRTTSTSASRPSSRWARSTAWCSNCR